jgi:hypothetical protein
MDFSVLPTDDAAARMPTFEKLSPLRHDLRRVLLSSRELSPSTADLDEAEAQAHALEHGLPIDRAYFGSAEGWGAELPGQYWDTSEYDPRLRPWYQLADHERGPQWGNPFVEIATESLLISCSTGVWSSDGAFIGVAGVGMAVRYIVEDLLTMRDQPAVLAAYLVNHDGNVVVSSKDADRDVKLGALDRGEEMPLYDHMDALEGMEGSGTRRYTEDGAKRLLVTYPLESTGWRYVVEVDHTEVLR